MARRDARVVAELGRPETPEEAAARKADDAARRRQRQTVKNLVGSLLASLAVVAVIVLLVPRSDAPIERNIDVPAVAAQAQAGIEQELAVPRLPDGWRSNAAELRDNRADGITAWYAGYLTPSDEYAGMYQGLGANPTWTADLLANTIATGVTTIDGVEWTVYDNRETTAEVGNARYGLVTEAGESTFVLLGTAAPDEFETLARAIAPAIDAQR